MITNQLSFIFTPLWPTCGRRRRRLPEAQPQVCCGLHLTKLAHGLWSRLSCYHILSDPHWLSWMFYIKKKKNESSCFNPVDFCTFVQICFGVVCLFCCFLLLLLYSYDQFWNDAVSGLPVFQPFFFSPVWFFSPQKWIFIQQPEHQADFVEACCWTAGHICVASNRQSETLRLLKILNKLQMSVWFDTSEVWIFNFSCYVIQLFGGHAALFWLMVGVQAFDYSFD